MKNVIRELFHPDPSADLKNRFSGLIEAPRNSGVQYSWTM
jgi:hypothetical protein